MCQYQNPTCYVSVGELNEEEKQAILKKHNDIRREIGSSNMWKLVWDNERVITFLTENYTSTRLINQLIDVY